MDRVRLAPENPLYSGAFPTVYFNNQIVCFFFEEEYMVQGATYNIFLSYFGQMYTYVYPSVL